MKDLTGRVFKCPKCGKEFPLNIAICHDGYIGYRSEEHGCKGMVGFVLTPRSKEKKEFWKKII